MPGITRLRKGLWLEHEESETERQVFPQVGQPHEARNYTYHTLRVLKHIGVLERSLEVVLIAPKEIPREAWQIDLPRELHLCLQHTVDIGKQLLSSNYAAFHSASWIPLPLAERSHRVEHGKVLQSFLHEDEATIFQRYLSAC